ncbi:class I SAM-dependent methyltransferase [Leifsonia sp. A12D58]|uniref:class I SAM-dependent methyltransferase n=1 Tax=Leifsonia sp. A12D58 TaxID=3397674 RepID=UPI0039E1DB72
MTDSPHPYSDAYLELNKANWDERAPLHLASADYGVQRFVDDQNWLSHVVTFDRARLGDLSGLRAVHLQCHIGTDSISLARLGATVIGVDLSSVSIAGATELAQRAGTDVTFVEADVYSAVEVLGGERFDLVYTGIGALCWLPDIARWATTVASLLVPGGRLFIREGHPMLWAIDEDQPGALVVGYPYFEQVDPIIWDDSSTYVETDTPIQASVTHEWNHGLGEIITALFDAGLQLTALVEHTSVPWEALPGRMALDASGEWSLIDHPERLPLSYTLQAVKRA